MSDKTFLENDGLKIPGNLSIGNIVTTYYRPRKKQYSLIIMNRMTYFLIIDIINYLLLEVNNIIILFN